MKKNKKIYLSFLGASNYLPCNYLYNNSTITTNVRFIQEASILQQCKKWSENDQIYIFTTEQAEQKNWLDNGHGSEETGLQSRLQQLQLKTPVQQIKIPSGRNEQEIWQIFQCITDQIEPNSEIIFDITHAFRSIPMLALVTLNYSKSLWHSRVINICYGAMEALGTLQEIRVMPLNQRNVPIIDLTAFDHLLDWSVAIDRFKISGDTSALRQLADNTIIPLIKIDKDNCQGAIKIKQTISSLEHLTLALSTCRAKDISSYAEKLKNNLDQIDTNDLIKPLGPLLGELHETTKRFYQQDPVLTGLQSARWCYEHNLIQQAYTILQETCISALVDYAGGDQFNKSHRSLVTSSIAIVSRSIEWSQAMKNEFVLTTEIVRLLKQHKELALLIEQLSDNRNDINHAGYRDNFLSSDKLVYKLGKYLDTIEIILEDIKTTKQT